MSLLASTALCRPTIPTPPQIFGSSLVLWLRADLGITIATGISAWADQSGVGNNYTQPTGANQPTNPTSSALGSKACARFAGASTQFMFGSNALLGTTALTIGAVFAATVGDTGADLPIFCKAFNGLEYSLEFESSKLCFWTQSRANLAKSNSNLNDGLGHNAIGVYDGAHHTLYVDGTAQTTVGTQTGTIANTATDSNALGVYCSTTPTTADPWSGDVGEIIVCNAAATTTQVAQWQAYVHARYGL